MKTVLATDRTELGRFIAEQAAETIQNVLATKSECNLVVATGSSQFEALEALVQQPGIEWERVNGFHLDEYLGIARTHSASFCGYLAQRFVERIPLKSFCYLDGEKPAEILLKEAHQCLADKEIDLLMCGIGENGHLAFNDPPADFTTTDPYVIVELDEDCRRQQVGEGWFDRLEEVPLQAISMSIHQIMSAKRILCAVPDRRKAEAVRATLEDEVSPAVPASILRNHADTMLVLDSTSSSLLSEASVQNCVHLNGTST